MKFIGFLSIFLFAGSLFADSFVGIGVTIQKENKKSPVRIIELIQNGPAHRAGVQVGEIISSIDGVAVIESSLEDIKNRLVGNAGTFVDLGLVTVETGPERIVRIQRELIDPGCFLEGNISLRYNGHGRNGTLTGYIGDDYVRLTRSGMGVRGYIKDEYVSLTFRSFDERQPGSNRFEVRGFVKNTIVSWRGWNNHVNGFQRCIK